MRNKISDLRKNCRKTEIHALYIDETKLDVQGYRYLAFRKDCNKNGGRKIVDEKEGLIAKIILGYENIYIETI